MSPYAVENDCLDFENKPQSCISPSRSCNDTAFDPLVTKAFSTIARDNDMERGASRRTRCVTFSPKVKAHKIPKATRLSIKQKESMWWTEDELNDIRVRDRKLARGQSRWGDETKQQKKIITANCTLGLLTVDQTISQDHLIAKSRNVVLREQEQQYMEGVSDPDRLALAYWDSAHTSRREATAIALQLANEIKKQDTCPTPPKRRSPKISQKKQRRSSRLAPATPIRSSSNSTLQMVW